MEKISIFNKKTTLILILLGFTGLSFGQNKDVTRLSKYQDVARLYGYVRYFHPIESNRDIDWESFIYQGIDVIDRTDNRSEIEILDSLFTDLTDGLKLSYDSIPNTNEGSGGNYKYWQHYSYGLSDMAWYKSKIVGIVDSTKRMNGISYSHTFKKNLNEPCFFHLSYKNEALPTCVHSVRIDFDFYNLDNKKEQSFTYFPTSNTEWVIDTFKINALGQNLYLHTTINIEDSCTFQIEKIDLTKRDSLGDYRNLMNTISFSDVRKLDQIEKIQDNRHYSVQKEIKSIVGVKALCFKTLSNNDLNKLFQIGFKDYTSYSFKLRNGIYGTIPLTLPVNSTNSSSVKIDAVKDVSIRKEAIAAVIISWNIIQHFSPNLAYIEANWEDELEAALIEAETCTQRANIELVIRRMMAKLYDGHAVVQSKNNNNKEYLKLKIEPINGNYVITESRYSQLAIGDVLLKINGKAIDTAIWELEQSVSGSKHHKEFIALKKVLRVDKGIPISITYARKNNTRHIPNIKLDSLLPTLKTNENAVSLLEADVYLVDLFKITEAEFSEKLSLLKGAKGIVFDCRKGIRITHEILGHFIQDTIYYQPVYTPNILYPDRYNMMIDTSGKHPVIPKLPFIAGKTIFIIGPKNVSSEEGFLGLVDYYKIGTTIGNKTAGCNGSYNRFYCPGGLTVYFTGQDVKTQDNQQLYNIGIEPNFSINNSLEDIINGIDAASQMAIELIKKD